MNSFQWSVKSLVFKTRLFAGSTPLLFAVSLDVTLGCVLLMFHRLTVVAVSEVRVMSGRFMVAFLVVPGCFAMMVRSLLVMFRCMAVMLGCFF